jgi:multidrug efflux pump subunit AcrB
MGLALGVSFLVAWLLLPVAVAMFGLKGERDRGGADRETAADRGGRAGLRLPAPLGRALRAARSAGDRAYAAAVGGLLAWPAVAVLVAAGLIGVAWMTYQRIGTDFLPSMDEGSVILDYFTPPGTSLTDTDRMLREVEKVIQATPGVVGYSRRTGTELGFFITEPNSGDYVIDLAPRGTRAPVDEVIDDLRARIAAVEPALHTDFGQLIEDEIGDLTGGTPQPIDVKIFGSDVGVLQRKAREAARILEGIRGVEDVFDGITIAGPALDVRVDPVEAARFGLTTRDVHAAVEPAVIGSVVGEVRVGERVYDLRVFVDATDPLADLHVRSNTSPATLVPLSRLATISTGAAEAEIDRENLRTYVGVTARLSGRDLGSAISEIKATLARDLVLPPGTYIRYGGLYQQQQQSFRGLLYVLLSGLVLVSVIVLFTFGDWRAPLVTTTCAVAVLAGVLLALVLTGTTLNISSYVGAIMMVGIVGENAIFVIHEGRTQLRGGRPPREAWLEASRRRLRPVAMTVLATALALAPLAVAIGQGSQLMQPLAIAVIGGFVISGPIVLLLLPALYRLLDPRGRLGSG